MTAVFTWINNHKELILLCLWGFFVLSCITLMSTFFFLMDAECDYIKNCVYTVQAHEYMDCVAFSYQWVINNRSGCGLWCDDPFNSTSCPTPGSTCGVTSLMAAYCKDHGFGDIFACRNEHYYSLGLFFLIIAFMTMLIGAYVSLYYKHKSTQSTINETTPLYSNQS